MPGAGSTPDLRALPRVVAHNVVMRRVFLTLLAILVCVSAQASFVFSDIPWNTQAQSVMKKLKDAGFKQIRKDKQGDITFRGTLLGHDAAGMAMFAEGRLAKVLVMLSTPDEMAREGYTQVRDVLITKYGQPAHTTVTFLEPFHQGDGYEAEAIRSGKGIFVTQWNEDGEQLILNITSSLAVAVTYESPDWAAELERRKSKGAAAF